MSVAGRPFGGGWAHIFADCIDCEQSIGLLFESKEQADKCTNAQARDVFMAQGWGLLPPLCPRCREARRPKAYKVSIEGLPDTIQAATTPGRAKAKAYRMVLDAGYTVLYTAIRARRKPEFDKLAAILIEGKIAEKRLAQIVAAKQTLEVF